MIPGLRRQRQVSLLWVSMGLRLAWSTLSSGPARVSQNKAKNILNTLKFKKKKSAQGFCRLLGPGGASRASCTSTQDTVHTNLNFQPTEENVETLKHCFWGWKWGIPTTVKILERTRILNRRREWVVLHSSTWKARAGVTGPGLE